MLFRRHSGEELFRPIHPVRLNENKNQQVADEAESSFALIAFEKFKT